MRNDEICVCEKFQQVWTDKHLAVDSSSGENIPRLYWTVESFHNYLYSNSEYLEIVTILLSCIFEIILSVISWNFSQTCIVDIGKYH